MQACGRAVPAGRIGRARSGGAGYSREVVERRAAGGVEAVGGVDDGLAEAGHAGVGALVEAVLHVVRVEGAVVGATQAPSDQAITDMPLRVLRAAMARRRGRRGRPRHPRAAPVGSRTGS